MGLLRRFRGIRKLQNTSHTFPIQSMFPTNFEFEYSETRTTHPRRANLSNLINIQLDTLKENSGATQSEPWMRENNGSLNSKHCDFALFTPGVANYSRYFSKSSRGPRSLINCPFMFVPSLLLSNVMLLAPKIDEICEVVHNANFDLVCITESWLKDHIDDNSVAISGYNVIRRDRTEVEHGGICLYIKESIRFKTLDDMADENFEILWIRWRPSRLPRGITCIIVGLVYHSPNAVHGPILEYLYNCLSIIEARFPSCGTILLGDFNKALVKKSPRLSDGFKLKQLVNFPTRGINMLDPVFTNLSDYYDSPIQRPSFELSDHFSVELPLKRSKQPNAKITVKSRDLCTSNRLAMRTYLEEVDLKTLLDSKNTCEEKVEMLEMIVKTGMDILAPKKAKTIHSHEPPWMNSKLKQLIAKRQRALAGGDLDQYRNLRKCK